MTTNQNPGTAFEMDAVATEEKARDFYRTIREQHGDYSAAAEIANRIYSRRIDWQSSRERLQYKAEQLARFASRISTRVEANDYIGRSEANTDLLDSIRSECVAQANADDEIKSLLGVLNRILAVG